MLASMYSLYIALRRETDHDTSPSFAAPPKASMQNRQNENPSRRHRFPYTAERLNAVPAFQGVYQEIIQPGILKEMYRSGYPNWRWNHRRNYIFLPAPETNGWLHEHN